MKTSRILAVTVPLMATVTFMTATPASAASYNGGNAYARGGTGKVTSAYRGDGIYELTMHQPIVSDQTEKDGWRPVLRAIYKDYIAGNPKTKKTLAIGDDNGKTVYARPNSIATKFAKSVKFEVCGVKGYASKCTTLKRS
ncbi:hypothetical protein [Streptomyces triculaminicus]|uniref:hypothetical protein n=1 Tax=Streptomyces triculaminicus TaxID=2816232 RepID=UPI0037CDEA5D